MLATVLSILHAEHSVLEASQKSGCVFCLNMASPSSVRKANKRQWEGDFTVANMDRAYKFKILLPNGSTVELTVRDPRAHMPFEDFVKMVKDEYFEAWRRCDSMKAKRPIKWHGRNLYVEDAYMNVIRESIDFEMFKPHKCHILKLYDGSGEMAEIFENMWDLTPDTDLLKELPEEYTFETALADLIDNSLQAVWNNGKNDRRLISVDIAEDRISIFDSGPGMDGTDENSIVKWGKMGASLHRASKGQAVGLKPPYLMPFFGMFGYGGPIASMHLGRHALVSSKTKVSKKVYTLHLEKEALIRSSDSELTWRTSGGIRVPTEDEIKESPHGSFTKVEILETKLKGLDIFQLQCKLKDIYFPYIQCDEVFSTGKTARPIEFQVNGLDLAEIEGGEVAVTNLHACNGPDFVLELHLSLRQDSAATKSLGSGPLQEANARLKFVYFPVSEGAESIEIIMEKLKSRGCGVAENYETFSRVSIRRLGRLLPDARRAWLPFMDLRHRKGDKAHLLKKFCLRVKCFIDTDAGFNPTPAKTDLAHKNPFTIALKNFGGKNFKEEKDINVEIYRDGKLLTPLQLEKDYQEWLLQMHDRYDEVDCGVDQPILIVSPKNKKKLGISSDVARAHKVLKRKGATWKSGQKVKLLKGAYAGIHNNNVYAMLEYFLMEGFEGDTGGEARIICRPLGVSDKKGCVLSMNDGIANLDVGSSLSLPIGIIDSGKCVSIDNIDWDRQLEKHRQKSPSTIELLNATECQELELDGELPSLANAGQVPPREIVAVIRPASFISSSALNNLDQKFIVKDVIEMVMEVKFTSKVNNIKDVQNVFTARVAPSSRKGYRGLYIFEFGWKFPKLFQKAGTYTFSFFLTESSCKSLEKKVVVNGSSEVGKWKFLSSRQSQELSFRVGSLFPLFLACYDIYDNRIPFKSIPDITVKLSTSKSVPVHADKLKMDLSADKLTLRIKDILIESFELDKIRPYYRDTLVISPQEELVPVLIPCRVTPGSLKHVAVQPPNLESIVLPDSVVKLLKFEMFDAYSNHVKKGLEVEFSMNGFCFEDCLGLKRKVDDYGCIDLSGLLKVTAGYGQNVSLSVLSDNGVVFKQEFQTEKRELRLVSGVPECCTAGSQLKDITFEIVDSKGDVDIAIHDDDKSGQSHTLRIKSELISAEDSIRYAFRQGRCTVPAISLPQNDGYFCFAAAHSRYTELHLSIKVHVMQAPKVESDEFQIPCSDGKVFLLEGSSSIKDVGNQMVSIMKNVKEHEDEINKYGLRIGNLEEALKLLCDQKTEIEQVLSGLQVEPHLFYDSYSLWTKEEMTKRILSRDQSAASFLCGLTMDFPCHKPPTNFMEDVVGPVVLIGTVCSKQLSRTLAEYLGEDQMLALVCRSFEAAQALEKYEQNGKVDFTRAVHATAAALGQSIVGRFLVVCLEDIRPFPGEFEGNDPQRRLALPDPTLPSGNIPLGFMGYAVNMINLDDKHIHTRIAAGYGLRETLFYRLLGELQVYRTRKDMIDARTCINHGAVSLDGGILKENGIISLGHGNPTICFPVVRSEVEAHISAESMEKLKQIEEKRSELNYIMLKIEKYSKVREKCLKKLNKRTAKFNTFMDDIKPVIKDSYYLEN
ncbi:Protein defective in meristem silencing 3 [Melia azedarach]|uniref:Protein defective in meristem silencing 3 n=1 Tax=Melia azedarach TaxID=155640 RepID=A0ACC1YTJ3_MELAZ|nr:Protein defective in meristem silencing 3 [Melia azedarach]